MNFQQLQTRLNTSVLRTDLAPNYPVYVNEALMLIQQRRSWICMKAEIPDLQMPTGTGREEAALPANFKELQPRISVFYVLHDGGLVPAEVVREDQQAFRIWAFGGTPLSQWPPRIYYERRGTGAILGVYEPCTEPFTLHIKYYQYLPQLVNPTDSNPFTIYWPQMVLAAARAAAFIDINDYEAADGAEKAFEGFFKLALAQDAHAEVAGRDIRM